MSTKNNRPVAVVLGGTNPHKALIKNLRKRGYYTILIDYYENPPAKSVADIHIRESTLDKEKVLEVAKSFKAKLVIAICIDQANSIACYVAEKLGLPIPYSYETSISSSNKMLMKRKMIEAGIPTSKFVSITDLKEIDIANLNFPLVVKPADTTGSKGVKRVDDFSKIKYFVQDALSLSRTNTAIVEEFKEGIEVQIDCFVRDKEVLILMLNKKNKVSISGDIELQSIGSSIPAEISKKSFNTIKQIANKLVKVFNFDNTPFFIQTIVKGDEVNVIEFAPRIGGGLSYRIINLYSSFDTLNHAVDFYEGKKDINLPNKNSDFFTTNNIYTKNGVFGEISGSKELLANNIIEEFYQYKTKGMLVGSEISSNNRIGAFIIRAKSNKDLREKEKIAYSNLKVVDIENNNMPLRNYKIEY
jgi:phosphoribosylamine-glycine ligase